MQHPTLLISAGLALTAALVFVLVGRTVMAWRPGGSDRLARDAFALWWFGLAFLTAVGGARFVLAATGFTSLAGHLSLMHLTFLALFVALWGLLYYLLYVYTGSRRIGLPLGLFYASFYLGVLYLIAAMRPVAVSVAPWRLGIVYENQATAPVVLGFLALLLLPMIAGVVLYSLLYFRVQERAQKRRVALVSGAFLVWFGTVAIAAPLRVGELFTYWPVASRLLGLGAALVILYAFRTEPGGRDAPAAPAAVVHTREGA